MESVERPDVIAEVEDSPVADHRRRIVGQHLAPREKVDVLEVVARGAGRIHPDEVGAGALARPGCDSPHEHACDEGRERDGR